MVEAQLALPLLLLLLVQLLDVVRIAQLLLLRLMRAVKFQRLFVVVEEAQSVVARNKDPHTHKDH